MGQLSTNGQCCQISIGKINILYSILAGESIQIEENLKKFYYENQSKNREEILIDVVNRCLNVNLINSQYIKKNFIPGIFDYILQVNGSSKEKKFIFTHFEKIILLGVNNQDVFIQFLLKIAEEHPKENQKIAENEQIDRYNYIKDKYSDQHQKHLETIKESYNQQAANINAFNVFIDFIYQSIKNDEKEILNRKVKATDLLNAVALERQQQQEKKESLKHLLQKKGSKNQVELRVYDDDTYSTDELKKPVEIKKITSKINDDRASKNNQSKETVDWSDQLLSLKRKKFSDQQVITLEKEIKQAISDDKETAKAVNALTDLYLLCSKYYINHYNRHYKSIIIKNKETFGTPDFDAGKNRQITEALDDISNTLKNVSQYLEKAQSTLKILISLAGNNSFQPDNDVLLQITSNTFKTLLNDFLDHLQDLGEWKNNKLNYIKKNNIISKKSLAKKETEREAFKNISHCVKSLDNLKTFIQEYLEKQQPYNAIMNAALASPDSGLQQSHQIWCIGSKRIPAGCSLPPELLNCSC